MTLIQRDQYVSPTVTVEATTQSVGDTTTETTIFSKTILAGTMGSNGKLDMHLSIRHAKAANPPTITYRVKLGGTTIWTITGTTPANSATNFSYLEIRALIANKTASSQRVFGFAQLSASVAGDSDAGMGVLAAFTVGNAAAINTALDQTLSVTAQWSASPSRNPSVEMFYGNAVLEKV